MKKNLIIAAVMASLLASPSITSAGVNDVFKGWGWNGANSGWVSLNSSNVNTGSNYGVTVDDSKNIFGWAWSSNLGWVCFGSTCPGDPPGAPASSWALYDDSVTPPEIRGWARVYSLYSLSPSGQQGWISLNCSNSSVCISSNSYKIYVDTDTGLLHGYGWNCTTSTGTGACNGPDYTGGFGWIRFDPDYVSTEITDRQSFSGVPWLQVLYGDLYAKGNISTPSPFTTTLNKANASYCIDKGVSASIQHFQSGSAACASGSVSLDINAPKASSNYSNVLGRIRLRGYDSHLAPLSVTDLSNGKYGPWSQAANLNAAIPAVLGGRIYDTVSSGNWTMNARQFNNGSGIANGAGLIIVRGNLQIAGDVTYQGASISNLRQLASVGILVLDDGTGTAGNITVSPSVGTISANIYAEGKISTGTTGDPTTEIPVVINGVVVAKQFNLERQFPGDVETPSEKIVYDGRIVANTPPGLNDFVASLPTLGY